MPTMRERIEQERSRCAHPGVRVGGACYSCIKFRAGLILPRCDPEATPAQLSFVGVNGHRQPSSWRPAESLLALWAEVEPHPIERTAEWGARSVPIREEARAELEAMM